MTIFISNSGHFLKMFFLSLSFFSLFSCLTISEGDKQLYNKALEQARRGESLKAIEIYQQVLEKNPNYDKARYNLTLLLINEKQWVEVEKELSFLEERMPKNTRVLKLKAFALFREGRERESWELYRELALRLPTDREILYNFAYLSWWVNQDKKEAIRYLKRLETLYGSFHLADKEWIKDLGYTAF